VRRKEKAVLLRLILSCLYLRKHFNVNKIFKYTIIFCAPNDQVAKPNHSRPSITCSPKHDIFSLGCITSFGLVQIGLLGLLKHLNETQLKFTRLALDIDVRLASQTAIIQFQTSTHAVQIIGVGFTQGLRPGHQAHLYLHPYCPHSAGDHNGGGSMIVDARRTDCYLNI
jgi:hypothetical protein